LLIAGDWAIHHVISTSTGLVPSGALGTGRRLETHWDRVLSPPMTAAGMGIGVKKCFSATSRAVSGLTTGIAVRRVAECAERRVLCVLVLVYFRGAFIGGSGRYHGRLYRAGGPRTSCAEPLKAASSTDFRRPSGQLMLDWLEAPIQRRTPAYHVSKMMPYRGAWPCDRGGVHVQQSHVWVCWLSSCVYGALCCVSKNRFFMSA
jgi:hypothetical protein